MVTNFRHLPGGELVSQGIADAQAGIVSESALLVLIAAPRLKRLGIQVSELTVAHSYEHELYALVERRENRGAHSNYNSLIRLITSFAHALEREASAERQHYSPRKSS